MSKGITLSPPPVTDRQRNLMEKAQHIQRHILLIQERLEQLKYEARTNQQDETIWHTLDNMKEDAAEFAAYLERQIPEDFYR